MPAQHCICISEDASLFVGLARGGYLKRFSGADRADPRQRSRVTGGDDLISIPFSDLDFGGSQWAGREG